MLYIFSNTDDKSIHHIVCTDSDIRAGIIISRIYERERISGEPVRVQFHNDTVATASVHGSAKRYEALKRTDMSNDTFEEAVKVSKINLSKDKPAVAVQYKEFINDIIIRYSNDKRYTTLKDFIYNYIDLKGCDAETLYRDVDAEIYRSVCGDFKEEMKAKVAELSKTAKPDVAPVVPYNDIDAFLYSANVNELVARYYKNQLNTTRLDVIKEVARNNNYDVDKFVKDVVAGHEAAYTAHKANIKKSNTNKDEK